MYSAIGIVSASENWRRHLGQLLNGEETSAWRSQPKAGGGAPAGALKQLAWASFRCI